MPAAPFTLVDTESRLDELVPTLEGETDFFLDTEFDSSQRGTRLCLVQIATTKGIALVDPIRLPRLQALGRVLGAPGARWIVHAGSQDVPLLRDALGTPPPARLFDTQVAWALLTAESSVSLAYLKYRLLGLRGNKAHQTDDWTRRPLALPLLEYAASDVAELPELARKLLDRAETKARAETIYAASHETLTKEPELPPELTLKSFRNAWQLGAESQAALRALMEWYNALPRAARLDVPEPKVLLAIASRIPESPDVLARLKGVSRSFVDRYGRDVTRAMKQARENSFSGDFVPLEPPPYTTFEDERLDAWFGLLRAEVCARLEVAPDFVLPQRVMRGLREELRLRGPDAMSVALTGFRKGLLEGALADFAREMPPPPLPAPPLPAGA